MIAISTSTLLMATILGFAVGILLIGGGITYLIVQNRKERKAASLNAKRQSIKNNPMVCHPPHLSPDPSLGKESKQSE